MDGRKDDQEKPRYDLLPMEAVDLVAQVLTYGADKYAPNNWRKVEDGQSRYLAAALRHLSAHMQGEEIDAESGLPHLGHATCSLMFMIADTKEKSCKGCHFFIPPREVGYPLMCKSPAPCTDYENWTVAHG